MAPHERNRGDRGRSSVDRDAVRAEIHRSRAQDLNAMAAVVLANVHKVYGHVVAVKDINLDIRDREFVVLVGPSGCGKSTTLRMIAGLEEISGGTIAIGGRVVNHLQPKDRDIAMVVQNYALYQHLSLRDNLAVGLRKRPLAEAAPR